MCQDPPGKRLPRFAICSCGAYFPECDLEDFRNHATSVWAVNHKWVYIHPNWREEKTCDPSEITKASSTE